MSIVRWDPFREFRYAAATAWVPPVDIYQSGDHELVLKAELPDMAHEDIDITVENSVLTIKGQKRLGDVKEEQFHHVERRYGAFSRSFSLPPTVDSGRVGAEYRNGVLEVHVKKPQQPKPKRIEIGSNEQATIEGTSSKR